MADKAESHLTRALELRRRLFGPDHEKVAESLVDYAWNLAEQSRHAEAETNIREALRIYRARGTAAAPVIQAEWSLQRFLISLKRFDEAEVVAKEALALAGDSGGEYPERGEHSALPGRCPDRAGALCRGGTNRATGRSRCTADCTAPNILKPPGA